MSCFGTLAIDVKMEACLGIYARLKNVNDWLSCFTCNGKWNVIPKIRTLNGPNGVLIMSGMCSILKNVPESNYCVLMLEKWTHIAPLPVPPGSRWDVPSTPRPPCGCPQVAEGLTHSLIMKRIRKELFKFALFCPLHIPPLWSLILLSWLGDYSTQKVRDQKDFLGNAKHYTISFKFHNAW